MSDDIDYEALGQALYATNDGEWEASSAGERAWQIEAARDVITAYRKQLWEQGLVVVRAEDVARACVWHTAAEWADSSDQADQDARDRLAALADPVTGEEPTDG